MKRGILLAFLTKLAIGLCIVSAGCRAGGAPRENKPREIAYSGNEKNAGMIGLTDGGGVMITPEKRDEYNALIDLYGTRFHPALKHDDGCKRTFEGQYEGFPRPALGDEWIIDREHVVKFALMKSWEHRGDRGEGAMK